MKPSEYVDAIRHSRLTIYDTIEVGSELWIPAPELETILRAALCPRQLDKLANRTRSKVVKQHVCGALGYPEPPSFKRVRPRFPGQALEVHTQKSNNVQIYNQEIVPVCRYAIFRVSDHHEITHVRVMTGESLALLDTGTLTAKYQARLVGGEHAVELISKDDSDRIQPLAKGKSAKLTVRPTEHPSAESLLPIRTIFTRLKAVVGKTFADRGRDQERNRGGDLHRLVCEALGYNSYADDGRFPDVRHQLLEVKLQTSPTIDLGCVLPSSEAPLDTPQISGTQIRHCDTRYAVFEGVTDGMTVRIIGLHLATGRDFLTRFRQFGGLGQNLKRQIRLPTDFFDR